ncbi:MAG: SDR family NAD(P)-dependent oxidoreductase [Steroidobacteraceae bacterium]
MTSAATKDGGSPVTLITGAGRGIGRACAAAFAAADHHVIAVARTAADLEALAEEAGPGIEAWVGDVRDEALYRRIESLPRLDVLVNNAGINKPLPIAEVDGETLNDMIDVNVRAAYRVSQSGVRAMLRAGRGGSIVHVSSQMGHVGAPRRTAYCMTKHAIEGLTKSMAVELAPANIRVNSVAPTFIETDLTRPMFEQPEFRDWVMGNIPLGRLGAISDVVAAVLFLCSPGAGMITGHSLRVDGGWTAR